eukprot:Rmarinus@m.929
MKKTVADTLPLIENASSEQEKLARLDEFWLVLKHSGAGIPWSIRAKAWPLLLKDHIFQLRSVAQHSYLELLQMSDPSSKTLSEREILKDVDRTNVLTTDEEMSHLRNILFAYARRNPRVSYCQGMNVVGAVLVLLFEEDEETAFWILCVVVELMLPEYFSVNLFGLHVDQRVLESIVARDGRLYSHLQELGVSMQYMTTHWFLMMFVTSLPLPAALNIWDGVFALGSADNREGVRIIFGTILTILRENTKALLECQDGADVNRVISKYMEALDVNERSDIFVLPTRRSMGDYDADAVMEYPAVPSMNGEMPSFQRLFTCCVMDDSGLDGGADDDDDCEDDQFGLDTDQDRLNGGNEVSLKLDNTPISPSGTPLPPDKPPSRTRVFTRMCSVMADRISLREIDALREQANGDVIVEMQHMHRRRELFELRTKQKMFTEADLDRLQEEFNFLEHAERVKDRKALRRVSVAARLMEDTSKTGLTLHQFSDLLERTVTDKGEAGARAGNVDVQAKELFRVFDVDRNGKISFSEMVLGLSVLWGGSNEARLRMLFNVYDKDGSGFIDKSEFLSLVQSVYRFTLTPDAFETLAADGQRGDDFAAVAEAYVERVFPQLDKDDDGRIGVDEWILAVHSDVLLSTCFSQGDDDDVETSSIVSSESSKVNGHAYPGSTPNHSPNMGTQHASPLAATRRIAIKSQSAAAAARRRSGARDAIHASCGSCRSLFKDSPHRPISCSYCGNAFCWMCASRRVPIPEFELEVPVHVCDECYKFLSSNSGIKSGYAWVKGPGEENFTRRWLLLPELGYGEPKIIECFPDHQAVYASERPTHVIPVHKCSMDRYSDDEPDDASQERVKRRLSSSSTKDSFDQLHAPHAIILTETKGLMSMLTNHTYEIRVASSTAADEWAKFLDPSFDMSMHLRRRKTGSHPNICEGAKAARMSLPGAN